MVSIPVSRQVSTPKCHTLRLLHIIFRILPSSPFKKYSTSYVSQVLPLFVSLVTWWYWISTLRYWLVFGGTGSEQGGTGCSCDILSDIWFTWCKPSNYLIFGEDKTDDVQTDRQNFLSKTRPFLRKGSSKNWC